MAEIKLSAEQRTEFGKGAARRIRRENKVPAVLYGHGTDPVHVTLPGHETMLALKTANALLAVELDSEKHLAIPKDVQRDPLKGFIEHVDLLIVRRGEKVTVDIAINVVGDPEPGVLVVTENASVSLEVEATHIPTEIEVSVTGRQMGEQVLASDLDLPEGAALAVEDDYMILNLTHAPTAAEVDAELEGAEADAGIERDESETPEPESVEG
ncbi:50S ribosomal protein L25/general stress protein Ctc [Aeromicrobium sp. 636]|uniref:Large ribosomal subunit protein bL25 n=1 Tax=Aeromicrobium senzhongii TaxID=2663859 RepID=A0A8I0EYB9_9ACTN|nr:MULTISPECIES: 50S ribosomal protein L25/general stress protein Ctc [Aeromicrobium]MBC9227570.1 50S ribosomal protein L25/general stress protein Ctc [Aeromicrobium senzhongii]MCQ3999667.1 50S ribosomal protein L25/general stress protein Ctc [Aeromicrobium sp. 636]MTB88013.1 50S ribosomal protein L25/general stress protein Ctc [Aeromicrobium senzhongii]QNL94978.1 50S ribosomal protein L25/general stress protein Ctc [Aeromicrobium senzhongii]